MEILKPIFVKRWLNSSTFRTYVFNSDDNNKYSEGSILIKGYIFQDNNYEDAFNKIAYYISQQDKDINYPFYFWTDDENLMFDINEIKWKGYNINPFKSTDRNSELLKEPIDVKQKHKLLNLTDINIVFYNDFGYDIPYYYNLNMKKDDFNKKTKELIKNEEMLINLYNKSIKFANISLEEYNDVSFSANISEDDNLLILFDKISTNEKFPIMQLINNNNAIYKLFKEHNFINERDLAYIFNIVNSKGEQLNIYYRNKNSKLTIISNEIIINFKYHIDNGNKWDKIIADKQEIVKYINDSMGYSINPIEKDINLRIKITIDNIEYPTLIKKIGTFSNIFEAITFKSDKKKNSGFYIYKRVNDLLNNKFDVTSYIKSRLIVGIDQEEIVKELVSFGYTKGEASSLVKNELQFIGDIGFNNLDKNPNIIEGTYIVVKKSGSGFEIDIKNCKSYIELYNIKFWLTKIIEHVRDTSKKIVKKELKYVSPPKDKTKSPQKSSSQDDNLLLNEDIDFDDLDKFKGGAKGNEYKNYLINRLRNADKELYKDNNKSRKCQREHQPVVLSSDELNELKKAGLEERLDNIIEYGSNKDNLNYYTCPRKWCPISKIPLDESDANAKCPGENEEAMYLNQDMKNVNNPRYAYLIKKINLPCCGKKKPATDNIGIGDIGDIGDKGDNIGDKGDIGDIGDNIEKKASIKQNKIGKKTPANPSKNTKQNNPDNYEDQNYIMNKFPLPYINRYGDISGELYKILKPENYNDYIKQCISPNNINKKDCILRKGLIDIKDIPMKYDNIINVVAYLLGKSKTEFIKDVINKLDIITFISLDNANVCKDFVDLEPIIADNNKELYNDLILHLKTFKNININLPVFSDNSKEANYKKSRLLYIYKSYNKFIKFLSSDNYPFDKGTQYLTSLIAIIYNKLLILWDIERIDDSININIICPYYTKYIDLYPYLDKTKKFIMIIKENNYYEPLITRSLNMKNDKLYFSLNEYPVMKDILLECSNKYELDKYNISIFNNKENLNILNKIIKDESEFFVFESIIINNDYTIDKILLKNNILLRFKQQSILILPLIVKEFNIKNILFNDDIINKEYNIKIYKDVYNSFKKYIDKITDLGFEIDIGENIVDTNELMRNRLIIKDNNYEKINSNSILPFDSMNNYHNYIRRIKKKKMNFEKLRYLVKNTLLNKKFTDEYYKELSKKSRKHIIKTLLNEFRLSNRESSSSIKDIQIILEEIPLTSISSIKKWYNKSLLYSKYDYVNELSNGVKDIGKELLFSQYTIMEKIPKNIINYHEAMPNNTNYIEEVKNNYKLQKREYDVNDMPEIFKGEEHILNSKWTKYKKKIWYKLRYIKNNYNEKTIEDFFNYFLNIFEINIIDYSDIIKKVNDYYLDTFESTKNAINYNDKRIKIRIKKLFKDPHFYSEYVKEMNIIKKTKKSFKTLRIFFDTYFDNSDYNEKETILKNIIAKNNIKFANDIHIFYMSKLLNISIILIHNRSDYGKAVKVDKRAGDKDLNVTSTIFKADDNLLHRPLIMLYRKVEKNNITYSIIKNIDYKDYYYYELQDSPDEIKNKIINNISNSSSQSNYHSIDSDSSKGSK